MNSKGNLVLVGHSLGADNIVELVNEHKDIKVNVMITIAYNRASKEFVVAVIVHEALHAYFRATSGTEDLNDSDHQNIAQNYIEPMAQFLNQDFGISKLDATSIAWRGVEDSKAYKDATTFKIVDGQQTSYVPKSTISQIGTQYYINQKGTNPCPTN